MRAVLFENNDLDNTWHTIWRGTTFFQNILKWIQFKVGNICFANTVRQRGQESDDLFLSSSSKQGVQNIWKQSSILGNVYTDLHIAQILSACVISAISFHWLNRKLITHYIHWFSEKKITYINYTQRTKLSTLWYIKT